MRLGSLWFRSGTSAWVARVDGKIKTLCKGEENKAQAEAAYALLKIEEAAANGQAAQSGDLATVATVYALWAQHAAKLDKPPRLVREPRWSERFLGRFGETQVKNLKGFAIEDWSMEVETWSDATRGWVLRMFSTVFDWLLRREYVTRNPFLSVKKPNGKARGEECVIEPTTFNALRSVARPWMDDIMVAMWFSGGRPSEILRAHSSEYNRRDSCLHKAEHKMRHKGMSRTIHLAPPVVAIVERRLSVCPDGFLFVGAKGRPLSATDFCGRLTDLKAKAGLTGNIIPYSFRHSFACRSLLAGIPAEHVAAMMGHRGTKTLFSSYSHTLEMVSSLTSSLDKAYDAMNVLDAHPSSLVGSQTAGDQ